MPGDVGVHVVDVDAVEAEVGDVEAGALVGEKAALGLALPLGGDHISQLDPLLQLPRLHVEHEDVGLALGDNPDKTPAFALGGWVDVDDT